LRFSHIWIPAPKNPVSPQYLWAGLQRSAFRRCSGRRFPPVVLQPIVMIQILCPLNFLFVSSIIFMPGHL